MAGVDLEVRGGVSVTVVEGAILSTFLLAFVIRYPTALQVPFISAVPYHTTFTPIATR
jgi:hypothetical protein